MPSRLFIAALWSPAGKGLASWLLLVMLIVLCYFSMWYPGSGVVLDRIVSRSLPSFLLKPFCIVHFLLHCLFNFVSDTPFYFIFILRVRHFEFKYYGLKHEVLVLGFLVRTSGRV